MMSVDETLLCSFQVRRFSPSPGARGPVVSHTDSSTTTPSTDPQAGREEEDVRVRRRGAGPARHAPAQGQGRQEVERAVSPQSAASVSPLRPSRPRYCSPPSLPLDLGTITTSGRRRAVPSRPLHHLTLTPFASARPLPLRAPRGRSLGGRGRGRVGAGPGVRGVAPLLSRLPPVPPLPLLSSLFLSVVRISLSPSCSPFFTPPTHHSLPFPRPRVVRPRYTYTPPLVLPSCLVPPSLPLRRVAFKS